MQKGVESHGYERGQIHGMLELACQRYQTSLQHNPEILSYLKQRGFSQDSIKRFRVGYSPNAWQFLTSESMSESGEFIFPLLEASGLAKTSEGGRRYDFYRDRITFPIFDAQGNIVSFTARRNPEDQEKSGKYINGPETKVYSKNQSLFGLSHAINSIGLSGLKEVREVFITEGAPDVILSHQRDFNNVLAPCGTSYTQEQVKLVSRYFPNATQVLCFDGDEAGQQSAERSVTSLFGSNVEVCILPEGQDLADIMTRYKNPDFILSQRQLDLEFLWNRLVKKDTSKVRKLEAISKLSPLILSAPRDKLPLYCDLLASYSDFPNATIRESITGQDSSKNTREPIIIIGPNKALWWEKRFIGQVIGQGPDESVVSFYDSYSPQRMFLLPESRAVWDLLRTGEKSFFSTTHTPLFQTSTLDNLLVRLKDFSDTYEGELNPITISELIDGRNYWFFDGQDFVPPSLESIERSFLEVCINYGAQSIRQAFKKRQRSLPSSIDRLKILEKND